MLAGVVMVGSGAVSLRDAFRDKSGPYAVELDELGPGRLPDRRYVVLPDVQVVTGMATRWQATREDARSTSVRRRYFIPAVETGRNMVTELVVGRDATPGRLYDVRLFVEWEEAPETDAVAEVYEGVTGRLQVGLPQGDADELSEYFPETDLRQVPVLRLGGPTSLTMPLILTGFGLVLAVLGFFARRQADA